MTNCYECLFLVTVGDFEGSNVKSFFTDKFKNVISAKNSKEAIEVITNNHIDVILFDSKLTNSFEFIENVKKLNNKILTFLATSSVSNEDLVNSINVKLDGYLLENYSNDELLKIINKNISNYVQNKENKFFCTYFDIVNENIIISKTNPMGVITYVNDKFCENSGYTKAELLGKNHNIARHPDTNKSIYTELWDTLKIKKETWSGVFKNIAKDGKRYYAKTMIMPILDKNKNIIEYISFCINITHMMNDKKQLLDEIDNNELSILALVEIEDYQIMKKFYNDGTIQKIEKKLGNSLLSHFPQKNIFEKVYFVGEGRYALLGSFFNYINTQKNLKEVLSQFVSNVNESILMMDDFECELNVILSFSYGKYLLFEDASHGLIEAISKNKAIHSSNDASIRMENNIKTNSNIIKKIKIALDNYKIVSYFQPIINNKTKKIEKHESLVRLIDEDDKIIFPFHFLNVAKEGNYYSKITHRILENTFNIVSKINTDVSINLSMVNIEKVETREILFELLHKYKDYNNKIIFELLESERVKDFNTIEVFIRDVKKLGVRIAIDDFGTGYSNFERLMKFKPDIIKIDGSLIKNIEHDSFSKNLVETISIFAKKQNIKTVAEFVETENIYNILTDMGIDYSQGYYFGRPEKLNFSEQLTEQVK